VAVLFLDLDDFKTVNDSLGHAAGDELLIAVAKRLLRAARTSDTVARFGGDEFAVLVEPGHMPQTAQEVAARIGDALKAPFHVSDTDVTMSVSIGIAIGESHGDVPTDLLGDADMAMYLAKRNGKARFEMYRPSLQDEALTRLTISSDIRRAINNGQLEVFYQPIVTAHDAIPVGAEALVRWNHPTRGLVMPDVEFIGVAESTGLIVALGDWVLNQACHQTQAWRHEGTINDDFYIAVNLSARQLAEPALVDNVRRALDGSGLPPRALVLEITESAVMLDLDARDSPDCMHLKGPRPPHRS
jgi:diguanylate cyclase (GGDEF)-like protein